MIEIKCSTQFSHLFDGYDYNLAVIHSSLEGQYKGKLYVDNRDEIKYGILLTQFDFHYIFGDVASCEAQEALRGLLFDDYFITEKKKEAIIHCESINQHQAMLAIMDGHSDIIDHRMIFEFNQSKFKSKVVLDRDLYIKKVKDHNSSKAYPICILRDDDKDISWCSGFMIGKDHVEIDVWTHEAHRQLGYGKKVVSGLILYLLEKGLIPDWNCWKSKQSSILLAESLGFELKKEVPVYIWVDH